jgi:aminoglycoside 6'-N-acetyltransferase I
MPIVVRQVRTDDQAEWLRMRCALWEDCPEEQQVREMEENRSSEVDQVFVAERPDGGLCGFLEAAIQSRANGCDSTPVGYIERRFSRGAQLA